MLANVAFPSSERFRVQCIPKLSIGSVHFPTLFTSYTFLLSSLFTYTLSHSGLICDNLSFNSATWTKMHVVHANDVTIYALWKVEPKFFKFSVCNPCQSSPSFTILVSLWFIIIFLVFFHLSKLLLTGFLQFKLKVIFIFLYDQNDSKCREWAHLTNKKQILTESAMLASTRVVWRIFIIASSPS